jgi:excinuclease ABC subunit C
VVVDGGAPQVNGAAAVLGAMGITDVAVCGLAKRLEEVWQPSEAFPVILPRTSEGQYLQQRVRDEAHRFAITFHRQRRSKRMITSTLDSVPGLGQVRRKALLRQFGSLRKLGEASVEEIAQVPGIGRRTAQAIVAALNPESPASPAAETPESPGEGPAHAEGGTSPPDAGTDTAAT